MNSKTASFVLFAWILGFYLMVSLPLRAQVVGATLSGTVTDQSGGSLPQATISIRNVATGIARASTTSSAGFYSVPNLLPGAYEVRASAQGFSTVVQTGITLTVGEQQVLNFTLQVGQMTQTIQVSTEAPNVELASSSISAVINSTTVRELPLNGRSWTDLAALQPGVSAITAQADFSVGGDRGNRGFGNQITIAGARPEQNNYRLDGVSINDFNNAAPGSVLGGDMGVDAIQEFSVLTSNVSAEYGRTSGGVINAITKSGTNQFHGSAYEFLRNDHLDAANFFENAGGIKKASFRQNQFGVAAGGPIRKDKLFVFGDYEGLRRSKGVPYSITVPSNAARLGILAGETAANQTAGTPCMNGNAPGHYLSPLASRCVDDNVAKYLPFWPVSTNIPAGSNGNTASYTFPAPQVVDENFFTIRGDDKISEKDSLAGTYLRDFTPYSSPDGLDAVLINSKTNRQIVTLEETHIFTPTLVNSARFGFSREWELNDKGVGAINPLANDPTLAAVPNQFAAHVLGNNLGIDTFNGGVNGNSNFVYAWNSYQGYDDAFWTHGTHSLKFGGGVERQQLNRLSHTDPSGVFTFGSLSDFLTNNPSKFTGEDATTVTPQGLRQTILGLYVQDDWRFRPNLTFNLGLRWEMSTAINDNHGGIVNLVNMGINKIDPLPLCGKFVPTSCAPGGPLFGNFTHRNFEPRVGFAWDPFRNGKTAVRGSFGVFDILPLAYQYIASATKQFPFVSSGSLRACGDPLTCLRPGDFYKGAFPKISPATGDGGTTKGGNTIEQYPHRSYDMQWNLNIQRELVKNLTAMVGYVGSRGVHEPFRVDDADIVIPTLTPEGRWLFPNPFQSGTKINPYYGSIGRLTYEGNSYFHALEVAVQKAMSHGIQFQTSFTWGKSMDTGSAAGHGDQFSNSISSLPYYDLRMLRTRSDFDTKRTLVVSATWQVPSPKSQSGPAAWIANGWELGWIFKANDGVPFTATWGTGNDPQGLNNGDDWAFPDVLTKPGCATLTNPGNPNHYIKTECFAVPTAPSPDFFNRAQPLGCDQSFGSSDPTQPNYLWCTNLRGTAGRNLLTGPGTTNLDFSIYKNHTIKRISESFNVQFRAEFFNILNHANFALPPIALTHTDIFDSSGNRLDTTAGVLTSTTTPGREIQFALKFGW
jgi:Carboxypeptidase regulatory-like domain/TonB dependent receptor/TonB-dependent Receptor Plug Domain